tara:strand:- start:791 stop:3346 length:2556 start_codon:yes stop_codon:yes gene_type:complete
MAVTIKLKNASGSDPSASDLVLGELAVRTDNGKIFLKKDNGSVAEVSGGGGVDDGDKGDITVSNSGDTWTIDSDATQVANKLPLAGGTLTGALTVSSEISARKLTLSDDGANSPIFMLKTDDSSPWGFTIKNDTYSTSSSVGLKSFQANDGTFYLKLQGDSEYNTFKIQQSSGQAGVSDREILTFNTSGNATFSGSVTASDMSTQGSGVKQILVGSTNAAGATLILDGDSNGDGSGSDYASITHNSSGNIEINNRKNASIIFKNTSSETQRMVINADGHVDIDGNLDVGAGVDVTGNITVSGTVDGRDLATDGTKLDGIEANATTDQTAAEILTAIKTVDGAGSGLDADTLDGVSSASFLRSDADDTIAATLTCRQITPASDSTFDIGTDSTRFTNIYGDNIHGSGANLTSLNASNISSGTIAAARVATLNQNTTGNAATATALATARTIAGVSFDGSANISLNNNAITNGAGYITSADGGNAQTVDGYNTAIAATANTLVVRDDAGDINGRYFEGEWFKGRTTTDSALGPTNIDGGGGFVVAAESGWYYQQSASATRSLLNVADGATNVTNNNQLTNGAGYITSADGGNAQTLDSLDSSAFLRSDEADTASGDISFGGGAGAVTINGNSDIRLSSGNWTGEACKIQHHSNWLYIQGGSSGHVIRRSNGNDAWYWDSGGTFYPAADSVYDIGKSGTRVYAVYADYFNGSGQYLTNIPYSALTGTPTIPTNNNQLTNGAGYVTSAGAPVATGARVWANVEGDAGTPYFRDSYGCSSLTDISYAVQQINFSTSFSNSNYCFVSGARAGSSGGGGRVVVGYDQPATSYFQYQMRNLGNNNEHVDAACLSFFGDM